MSSSGQRSRNVPTVRLPSSGDTRLPRDAEHDVVGVGHARDRFGIDEGNDLDAIEPGLRQGIDQRDLTRGRDRSLLDLKAFARAFLGDVNSVWQIAHNCRLSL